MGIYQDLNFPKSYYINRGKVTTPKWQRRSHLANSNGKSLLRASLPSSPNRIMSSNFIWSRSFYSLRAYNVRCQCHQTERDSQKQVIIYELIHCLIVDIQVCRCSFAPTAQAIVGKRKMFATHCLTNMCSESFVSHLLMTGSFLSNGTSKERDIHCSIGKDNFVDFTVKVICVASLYKNTLFL